jgi:sugar porter (SP) family MFS transporter
MTTSTVPDRQRSHRFRYRYIVPTAAIGVVYGYDSGSTAAAGIFVQPHFDLSDQQLSFVNTILTVGLLIGAVLGGPLSNRIGRRVTLLWVAGIFTVFAVAAGLAQNVGQLYAARLMLGIGIGLSTVAAPIYIAETAPKHRRGAMIALYQLANSLGIVLAYIIGWLLSGAGNWRLMFALSAIPAALVFLSLLRGRDTPVWYLNAGRRDDAVETLTLLGVDEAGRREVLDDHDRQSARSLVRLRVTEVARKLFSAPYNKALLFIVLFGALAKLTGVNALVYYQPLIFTDLGLEGNAARLLLPGLITGFSAIATVAAIVLVDRVGRRTMMFTGATVMLLGDLLIAYIFHSGTDTSLEKVLGFLGFGLFQLGFGASFGAMIWVFSAEMLPGNLRAVGASIALSTDFLVNILITQYFLSVFHALGGTTVFLFFAAMALVTLVVVGRLAPETKGRELDDVQVYWENGGRWE